MLEDSEIDGSRDHVLLYIFVFLIPCFVLRFLLYILRSTPEYWNIHMQLLNMDPSKPDP